MSSYSDIDNNNYCVLGICGSRARKELSHSVIVSYIDSCFAICKLRVYRYMLINQLIISSSVLSSLLQFCPSEKLKVNTCLWNRTGFEIRKCNELIWRIRIIIIQFKVSIKDEKAPSSCTLIIIINHTSLQALLHSLLAPLAVCGLGTSIHVLGLLVFSLFSPPPPGKPMMCISCWICFAATAVDDVLVLEAPTAVHWRRQGSQTIRR